MTIRQGTIALAGVLTVCVLTGSTMVLLNPANDLPPGERLQPAPEPTVAALPELEIELAERPNPELQKFLDTVKRSVVANESLAKHFELNRLGKEVGEMGAFIAPNRADKERIQQELPAVARSMTSHFVQGEWQFGSVRWLIPGREVLVITRHENNPNTHFQPTKLRWWLTFEQNRWRLYDVENLTVGGRLSFFLATSFEARDVKPPLSQQYAEACAALVKNDYPKVKAFLERPTVQDLPNAFRALGDLWQGIMRSELTEALEEYLRARQRNTSIPTVLRQQATTYTRLRQFEQAEECARKYSQAVPNDDDAYYLMGNARLQLNRGERNGIIRTASDCFRLALTENPNSVAALDGLRQSLNEEDYAELGRRLLKADQPEKQLDQLVRLALEADDEAAARQYVTTFNQHFPKHPEGLFQAALLRLHVKQYKDAYALLRQVLPLTTETKQYESYVARFIENIPDVVSLEEIDRETPPEHLGLVFRHLLQINLEDDNLPRVEQLIKEYRKRRPDDIWLDYYQAQVHQLRKEYPQAEKILAKAMQRHLDEKTQTQFRRLRLDNFVAMKQYLRAYELIAPRRETFRELSKRIYVLTYFEREATPLLELIEAHRKADPTDPSLLFWQGELNYRKGEYEAALKSFDDFQSQGMNVKDYAWEMDARKTRVLIRLNRVSEAKKYWEQSKAKSRWHNPILDLLLLIAAGDVVGVERDLEALPNKDDHLRRFYDDPDVAHYWKDAKYDELRKKYPAPKEEKE